MKKLFNEEVFCNNRSFLMGIAILLVVFLHSGLDLKLKIFNYLINYCYCGVDIFIFLSGFGMYRSLTKDDNILSFYKRRTQKILPTFYVFILFWIIFKVITDSINAYEIIGNLTLTGWFSGLGNQFNWYISAIIFLYFLSPLFVTIVKHTKAKSALLFIILTIIVSFSFFNSHLLIMFTRIPLYIVGMYASKNCNKENFFSNKNIIIIFISCLLGIFVLFATDRLKQDLMWDYGMYWYPFLLITPGICLLTSVVGFYFEKKLYFLYKSISFIGKYTFEIYLIHIWIFDVLKKYYANLNNLIVLCIIISSVIIGILFGKFIEFIIGKILKLKKGKA